MAGSSSEFLLTWSLLLSPHRLFPLQVLRKTAAILETEDDGVARAGKSNTSRNWLAYILIFKWVEKDLSHKDPQRYQLQQPPGI